VCIQLDLALHRQRQEVNNTMETTISPAAKQSHFLHDLLELSWIFCLSLFLGLGITSCSGTQVNANGTVSLAPGGTISVGIGIAVRVAKGTLPVLVSDLDATPGITPAAHAAIDHDLALAADALAIADTAATAYNAEPTVANQCRVHSAIEDTITLSLQGIQMARDSGATIAPEISASIGGLAVVADILYPNCPNVGRMVRHQSAQERVNMVFAVRR
jgi:hypothetical protein